MRRAPTGLVRFWKAPTGEIRSERLLGGDSNNPNLLDLNGNPLADGGLRSIVVTPDASVIAINVCIQGTCTTTGLDVFDPNSITVVFRSLDGGITWQEIVREGPVAAAAGVMRDGSVLISNTTVDGPSRDYRLFPGDTPITPPTGAVFPVVAADAIFWVTADERLIRPDGTEFLQLPSDPNSDYPFITLTGNLADPEKGSAILHGSDSSGHQYLKEISGDGGTNRSFTTDRITYVGGWFPKDLRAVLSISPDPGGGGPPVPALLHVPTGHYSLIPDPFQDATSPPNTGRTIVRTVQLGPFAHVTGTGSCLNIRIGPDTGDVLTCAADGVLLRDTGAREIVGDIAWRSVITPSGTQGWASDEFIEDGPHD